MGRASAEVSNSRPLLGPGAAQLRAMGLWRPGRSLLHSLAAALMLACLAWVSATAALRLLIHPPAELEEVALCSFIATICSGFTIKHSERIIVAKVDRIPTPTTVVQVYMSTSTADDEDIEEMYEEIKEIQKVKGDENLIVMGDWNSVVGKGCVVPALIGWTFFPLVSRALNDSGEESPGAVADWQFPVPHWVPVDMQRSPTYHLLYVLQSFCLLVASQSTIAVDLFFIHMMLMVAAEIEVLSENVSAMGKIDSGLVALDDEDCGPSTKYLLSYRDGNGRISEISRKDDISEDQVRALLVKNVQHHQTILQIGEKIQFCRISSKRRHRLVGHVLRLEGIVNLFLKGSGVGRRYFPCLIDLTYQVEHFCSRLALLMISVLLQFYSRGFVSTQILQCSVKFLSHANSKERNVDHGDEGFVSHVVFHVRRALLLFLTEAVRPVEITVGKTFKLSKQMLLQVLNGSYALLNLLYSIR
uniref:Odorant receptor n=1 Tax=Locusta migratoria TaxID=7004 RepID=A0A0M5K6L1_LOCMI|nr:odorant receptor 131 [Locusta migratoria]